ncbi:hypothetical protein GCM10008967_36050 [Bacillus carboniphilus]|uniref:LPXTG cell wall anchor domain-containing protein n=1 Tax=Bacillus carboniphilus TaxID=86663 RepID=A0ABN0WN46_9BACI
MFFILLTTSLILSITGGVLLGKGEQPIGIGLLVSGVLLFFISAYYYHRKKKGRKSDCLPDCYIFDCDDPFDCDGPDCGPNCN